ncbi:hypothetical protein [Arcobacter sp. CECT 8986]|uniref:hypothetical protein n=1 Tax=Arcobacter sp. CECT 8986 TaxID=2044507 RepID=UPI001009BAC1|nr:hypothetical protein [Arcobacter sp. CECT 8986]
MAITCPNCKKGTLKKGEKMVYCSEYKPTKNGDKWTNEGSCDFRIMFDQSKIFGKNLTPADIKNIVDGGTIENGQKKLSLDLDNKDFFVKIEKEEDEDL